MKPTSERIEELLEIVASRIQDQDHFDYHSWDDMIECDETMTNEELDWLNEHVRIEVSAVLIKD